MTFGCRGILSGLLLAAVWVHTAGAQGFSVDLSAGHLLYEPLGGELETNNVVAQLRFDSARGAWVYGAAALPMSSADTLWSAAGAGGRLMQPGVRRAAVGADLALDGYLFRDGLTRETGAGATVKALPFVRLAAADAFVELTGGARAHMLSLASVQDRRAVVEGSVRAGYGRRLQVDTTVRWVHASDGTFPYAGAGLSFAGRRVQAWGQAGRWFGETLNDVSWGGGVRTGLGSRTALWATIQQTGPDPLYWNLGGRSWSIGVTQRLGRLPSMPGGQPTHTADGRLAIRLRVADAPAGPISVGGDFTEWLPMPMQREGDEWILPVSLPPGVYHYAFRTADGGWFVPSSTPGRREDGFGGHNAVLVVSQ